MQSSCINITFKFQRNWYYFMVMSLIRSHSESSRIFRGKALPNNPWNWIRVFKFFVGMGARVPLHFKRIFLALFREFYGLLREAPQPRILQKYGLVNSYKSYQVTVYTYILQFALWFLQILALLESSNTVNYLTPFTLPHSSSNSHNLLKSCLPPHLRKFIVPAHSCFDNMYPT